MEDDNANKTACHEKTMNARSALRCWIQNLLLRQLSSGLRALLLSLLLVHAASTWLEAAPMFTSLYVFGHSWTDTQQGHYWQGRECNGPLWPEFLSTNFGLPYSPSNNFAVGGATSAQILYQQVFPLVPPADAASALFVLGAAYENDFLQLDPTTALLNLTNDVFWINFIRPLVQNTSNAIVTLYGKGARTIVVPDMGDFSMLPFVQGVTDLQRAQISSRCAQLNTALGYAVDALDLQWADLRLFRLNFRERFTEVLTHYRDYGFTKINPSALEDPLLANKAYDGPGKDYVWWDDVHPTSKMHLLWADWIYSAVSQTPLARLAITRATNSLTITMEKLNPNQTYKLQISPDLNSWSDLQSFTVPSSTNQFTYFSTDVSAVFFRLRNN
jgi:thermolabile hemolysin